MNAFIDTIDLATGEIDKLLQALKGSKPVQLRSNVERTKLKLASLTWFKNLRPIIVENLSVDLVKHLDSNYQNLLSLADISPQRLKCKKLLKIIKSELLELRNQNLSVLSSALSRKTNDTPPIFTKITSDIEMQKILTERWIECTICTENGAPLAAVVMMGGLLESLLLSKIENTSDKKLVFTAKTSPKDHKTGQTLQLKNWGLRNYIDVAHELDWITQTVRDLGDILRDYRNYIHPHKQLSSKLFLVKSDGEVLWELCKNISKQLIN